MDYASATPVHAAALRAMRDAEAVSGNPGAIHREGVEAKRVLDEARGRIAALISVKPREVVFTSGLTESNNLAILGLARSLERGLAARDGRALAGTHAVVSAIEHDSVLESFAEIEQRGGTVTVVSPDSRGIITPDAIGRALRKETVLVSVGWANNEIGTVQPLAEIARVIRGHEAALGSTVILHSDAGQAPLYRSTTAHSLGVDVLALGSNKLYGPHGVGALYVHYRANLAGHVLGGRQERGLRAGTENAALAAGFAAGYEAITGERDTEASRLGALRNRLADGIIARIPGAIINGDLKHALPHMLNVSIPGIQSEYVALALDARGIAVSTKSACREGEDPDSHVVAALTPSGKEDAELWRAASALRFSLGAATKESDIEKVIATLHAIVSTRS